MLVRLLAFLCACQGPVCVWVCDEGETEKEKVRVHEFFISKMCERENIFLQASEFFLGS